MRDRIQALLRAVGQSFARAGRAIRHMAAGSPPVRMLARYPLGRRLLTDAVFRAAITLPLGLLTSFAYGTLQCVAALVWRLAWLGALACCHMLRAGTRFFLLRSVETASAGTRARSGGDTASAASSCCS